MMSFKLVALFIGLFSLVIACIGLGYQFGKDISNRKDRP